MEITWDQMFLALFPGFFERKDIRALPSDDVFEEQILRLGEFTPEESLSCPENITFGLYEGDVSRLHTAIREVEEDWVQFFGPQDPVYCAFDGEKVVSFCILDEMGTYQGLRVAGPGCVGTVPAYRKKGIGLKMVQNATAILKDRGYDICYIHYTQVGHWYARLGYRTVLRWNRDGILR